MGQRICIMGNPGSGKSTIANELSKRLGIPVFHLDRELLYGNFERHPAEKQHSIHERLITGESWIIDGDYRTLASQRFERATLAIFLYTSRWSSLKRVFRRYRANSHLTSAIPEGAKNKLSWNFLLWTLKVSSRKRLRQYREIAEGNPNLPLVVLHPGKVSDLVEQIMTKLNSD